MKYRAEIDGLRALAVVPVILFHTGLEVFSGGFIGVDVFFVISGYLITTILIEDIENERFSIVKFYERRARRILPALFFVMLVCIPFAWLWMLPNQLKDFSQSLIAVSLFASNILFWRESGYFAAAAAEKPLLHTWSLAVEEQYYVLFPIFLILTWRFGKNRVFLMIIVMSAISLLLSEWGWRQNATANFYLAPSRAWELLAGSIAAFIIQKQGVQKSNLLAILGLLAIVFSLFFYNENTPFPSLYALVPVLGVLLIVLYADKETYVAKLLSTKGFVGLGLVSYSAYLWHQPLFAFARIKLGGNPPVFILGTVAIASFVLAFTSWKYLETTFRDQSSVKNKSFFAIAIVCTLAFCSLGSKVSQQSDSEIFQQQRTVQKIFFGNDFIQEREMVFAAREERETSNFSNCLLDISNQLAISYESIDCKYSKVILLVGDSHARDIYQSLGHALDQLDQDLLILSAHKGGCKILEQTSPACNAHYIKISEFIESTAIPLDTIVYTQITSQLITDDGVVNVQMTEDLLDFLNGFSNKRTSVVWLGPRSSIGLSRDEAARLCFSGKSDVTLNANIIEKFIRSSESGVKLDNQLRDISEKHGTDIKYVSQVKMLGQESKNLNLITDCQHLFWSNDNHFSRYGEAKFAGIFQKFFEGL